MSRAYFNETAKLYTITDDSNKWTLEDDFELMTTLYDKGYENHTCARLGCDRNYHNAILVQRDDIPRLIEQCFRQRLNVEVQAEGHGKASIIFVYDYGPKELLAAVRKFHRNNKPLEVIV